MVKPTLSILFVLLAFTACSVKPPKLEWGEFTKEQVAEYAQLEKNGTGKVSGQAFFALRNGGTVHGAGRVVTLDPVTTISSDWWYKAGIQFKFKDSLPPSTEFNSARRAVAADSEGRFEFTAVPPGNYYVRTIITWETPNNQWRQFNLYGALFMDKTNVNGGILGQQIEVKSGEELKVILSQSAQ